ncbi:RNB domain-containing ribonuclease [Litorihabitans aurantiacus]|uniref:Ribonuclease R n=1 Tax=Litorihabitans aurantiacus TaxID=1930061 RepID=A0AA37ULH8_9MICO|nr:RNB domain-containing ribonuclease [Litorihabitans aurantiacus]GMA30214.1 ribonuclease R [Litorihabitans aurantiacus]
MARRALRAGAARDAVAVGLERLRTELEIPTDFPAEALTEARRAAERGPADPKAYADRSDLELVTLDPPSSQDLDQAFHLARSGSGYVVHYAIADVAAFVRPGGALDVETHRRGLTTYGPDGRYGLHPPELSEGAASLLPDVERPAVLWRLALDGDGALTDVDVRRSWVRSRAKLSYAQVQADLDASTAPEMLQLLPVVGQLRADAQIERGGATLDVPDQEVARTDAGAWTLTYRAGLPSDEYNAQLSLLTGIAAARLHREAGAGIWRTLAPARDGDVVRLRHVARALGLDWPRRVSYGMFAAGLDASRPAHAAFATEATRLFRGAGYTAFGTSANPGVPTGAAHSAIAAEYAHTTAPLRRLVDRYAGEVALAHLAGTPVPEWVLAALDDLPATMAAANQRANAYEKASVDLVEAVLLSGREGEVLDAVVVESTPSREEGREGEARATVLVDEPAVRSRIAGPADALVLGTRVRVRVVGADVERRTVALEVA